MINYLHAIANWTWSTVRNLFMSPFEDRDARIGFIQCTEDAQRFAKAAQHLVKESQERELEWIVAYKEYKQLVDELQSRVGRLQDENLALQNENLELLAEVTNLLKDSLEQTRSQQGPAS